MAKEYFVKEEDIDVLKDNVDNKISSPNTAEVGQILSVKAIDGNGKPTEWEVVDKPGSGPGESSPYIYMTQEEYEALTEYEQDKMYWITYPCGDWLVWQNGEAILGQGAVQSWGKELHGYKSYGKVSGFYGKRLAIAFNPGGSHYSSNGNSHSSTPNLEILDIAKGVTNIGSYSFYRSPLKSIAISDSVASIEEYAFSECSVLPSIVIPDNVTTIYKSAFSQCTSIECIVFSGDSNTQPISLGVDIFNNNTSLVNVIGNRELSFDQINGSSGGCFYGCTSLKNVQMPVRFTNIGVDDVFYNCSNLENIIISETCQCIGHRAFYGTALKSINIPNSVIAIGSSSFQLCKSLETVEIGNGISEIRSDAFAGCPALKTIVINKPQDSISGAPWGATNATVVWTG